nr:reverse transcriptase domain-containing protein [Tanacetum cinerariifolium]
MEDEFYNMSVKGNDLKTYVRRFQELAVLYPNMVPNNEKLMEVFIGGLPRSIEENVTASKPQTLEEAINIAQRLMDQVTKHKLIQGTNDHKQKFEDKRNISSNNNYCNNYQNIRNNRTNDFRQQQNRRTKTFKSYAATLIENHGYTGNHPLCQRCTLHHIGPCTIRCRVCNKVAHLTKNCKNKGPATGSNLQPISVKDKQEKDKIGTKLDKNGKRGKARQCQRPITVKKAEKRRKYIVKGPILAIPKSCIDSSKRQGLKLKFIQSSTARGVSANLSKFSLFRLQNSFQASIRFYKFPPRWGNDPGVNPLIDYHCCYECGNSLNDFFRYQCTCEFCGNGAHNKLIIAQNNIMEQMTQLTSMCEMACQIVEKKQEEKKIEVAQAAKAKNSKIPACCDDDDDYNSAITPNEPSCVENLVPNPSESEGENGCDVPACFTTFSNILFDAEFEFESSDDQSLSDEDFSEEIFSNPLFEEEIISTKIDPHHFDAESDLIESMLNHDSSIISSFSKIDSLLDEFAGELILLKSIPPRIDETDCYPEEDIRLIERLLYGNSSPHPPKEFVSKNSNADIDSFSLSPILVEDSDSRMKEIDLFLTPDDPMPPSIEDDDNDSERDILIPEELLDNYSLSFTVNESFYFDISSFSRPLAKPPDGNTGILNIKMMGDNSKQKVPMPKLMITRVSNQEKFPDLLSHRGLEIFQLSAKCPMMIHGKNIPILDVPLFHFYPLDQLKYGGNLVKLNDLKQALRGRHPMLISSLVFLFSSYYFCLLCAIVLWKPVFVLLFCCDLVV